MIKKVSIYLLEIPFKFQITHNLAKRKTGESILVIIDDESGLTGCGEGTPRDYVTGETLSKSLSTIQSLATQLSRFNFISDSDFLKTLDIISQSEQATSSPSVWCAIEMACLDLFSKKQKVPFWKHFSNSINDKNLEYSAVIPILPDNILNSIIKLCLENKIHYIKLKVNDVVSGIEHVEFARKILGSGVDIRVDANEAFSATQTIDFLTKVKKYSISALEQPVSKTDINSFQEIKSKSDGVLIFADESINTIEDAKKLINADACHGFNIRLSKCGGIINCLKLCQIIRNNNLVFQIGCHVGESNILSAAGRHLATLCPDYIFLEGSFSKYMLIDDITNENISFGYRGIASLPTKFGLGVNIDFAKLSKFAKLKSSISF